jgi:DNA-binding LytR/AlgR family response regulator
MTHINTFIIDDEPDAGQLLNNLLNELPGVTVKKVFTDALQALDAVIIEQPPVIFLDVEMPQISGLEFLQHLNKFSPKTRVVFVTAYKDYALEALQNDAFDFVPKPIDREDLRRVLHKLFAVINGEKESRINGDTNRILLKTNDGHHYIAVEDILYLEADGNYTNLALKDGNKLLSSINLGRISEQFPKDGFVRISRKHIINKSYLTFMNFLKKYCVVAYNGVEHQLDVSVKLKSLKAELS